MVASLVVFLPGATLTTAVLELAAGQIVSGASRLVAGAVQLALLAFGILAGVEAVGVSVVAGAHASVGSGSATGRRGSACWCSRSAWPSPTRRPAGLCRCCCVVLYTAWIGQLVGNIVLGGYVSAFVGAR